MNAANVSIAVDEKSESISESINKNFNIENFARELDELAQTIKSQMGAKDLKYIKKIKRTSRYCEAAGRSLVHFSIDPVTWFTGMIILAVHLQLETTEIGHSALHGCWDNVPGAENFKADKFRWNCPVSEKG